MGFEFDKLFLDIPRSKDKLYDVVGSGVDPDVLPDQTMF